MKAVCFDPINDRFALNKIDVPQPGVGDVQVAVDTCGLNPVDAKIRFWKGMAGDAMNPNYVVGLDVSGHISALGEGVSKWRVGDQVLYHGNMLRPHGGLAKYAIQDADTLLPHPKGLSAAEAAATPCACWTAWRAIVDKLCVNHSDSLLIIGASGGVGSFAVQIAKKVCKAEKIIAVCSTANVDYVKSLGADHVIDYKTQNVVETVLELSKQKGVNKACDFVGGDNDLIAAACLSFDGHLLELVGTVRAAEYRNSFLRGLSFHQLSLGAAYGHGEAKESIRLAGERSCKAIAKGLIKLPPIRSISMEDCVQVLPEILKGRTVGKIVMNRS